VTVPAPSPGNRYLADHARLLLASYARLTGRELVATGEPAVCARALYEAPFVVVSHDTAPDPVFNYANLAAQRLFGMGWDEFLTVPSRFSAEPVARAERERLLRRVAEQGYIDDYAGVRIAKDGRRFRIEAAVVWNLTGRNGRPAGQAATFARWEYL
jgi:PAS domain-containing protein